MMMSDLVARIAPTPRERALLAILAFVAAFAGVVQAASYAAEQAARAERAALDLAEAAAASAATRDPSYRAGLAKAATDARAWSLDDPTFSIAAVRAQTDIEALARDAGISDVRVELARSPQGRSIDGPIRLIVEGAFSDGAFAAFLSALKDQQQSFGVEAVSVDRSAGSLRMVVRAPYQASLEAS